MKILGVILLLSQTWASAFTTNNVTLVAQTDGSSGDVQAACTAVAGFNQDGWTIYIGANNGTYTWSSVDINHSAFSQGFSNTVTMAGSSTNARPTIILNATNFENLDFAVAESSNKLLTIRDLIITTGAHQPYAALIGVYGDGPCFRITDVTFLSASYGNACITTSGAGDGPSVDPALGPFGCIDHCQFLMPVDNNYNCVSALCNGDFYNASWAYPMSWGTTNSVVIENCIFSQPDTSITAAACFESQAGGRVTFRHNISTNMAVSWHGANSGSKQSTCQVEVYNNTFMFVTNNNVASYVMLSRGGSAVIYSNTITENQSSEIATIGQFWVECAATNSASTNIIPNGATYSGSGFYTIPVLINTNHYQMWVGANDKGYAFGPTSGGASSATWYAALFNNIASSQTNGYLYLTGIIGAPVTAYIRWVDSDTWYVDYCTNQLFYPTNYVAFQQIGQGASTNAVQQTNYPDYMWSNTIPTTLPYPPFSLGHDGGDAPFIQQGRDVFTNQPMPGYTALVYPHPFDTGGGGGGGGGATVTNQLYNGQQLYIGQPLQN